MTNAVKKFRDERDWKKLHDPKELAIGMSIEVAEVLELFRYKTNAESIVYAKSHLEDVSDELVDVLYHVLLIADDLGINLHGAVMKKLEKTAKKYPIEKARGNNTKYTDYE